MLGELPFYLVEIDTSNDDPQDTIEQRDPDDPVDLHDPVDPDLQVQEVDEEDDIDEFVDGQEEQPVAMANLADRIPPIDANSSIEQALSALAIGVQVLSNEQEVDDATKAAVRTAAATAADITTRHHQDISKAERIKPMTQLPIYPQVQGQPAQRNDNIEEIKTPGLAIFKGTANKHECLAWLSRIMSTAKQHRLTDAATVNLMKAKCSDEAFDSIEQDLSENNDLETIVVNLERKFAGVCLPDEARIKCNTMKRKDNQMLSVFGDQLNKMARIATRHIMDDAEKTRQIKDLVMSNMKRVLPAATKHDLEERIRYRAASGKRPWTVTQFMAEIDSIEQSRVERIAKHQEDQHRRKKLRNRYGVRAVELSDDLDYVDAQIDELDSDDTDSNDEGEIDFDTYYISDAEEDGCDTDQESVTESDIAEDELEFVLNAVRQQKKPGFKGGKNKFHRVKKALKKVVDSRQNRYPVYRPPDGPPRLLSQCKINRNELPRLAKVDQDDCLHCGLRTNPPHKAGAMRCPLKGQKMVDRACLKCSKGLHQSNQCPTVRMQKN